jgi:hypothetical protein
LASIDVNVNTTADDYMTIFNTGEKVPGTCVDKLLEARRSLARPAALYGIKLTFLPILIKAASLALGNFPGLNARVEGGGAPFTLGKERAEAWARVVSALPDERLDAGCAPCPPDDFACSWERERELAVLLAVMGGQHKRGEEKIGSQD